MSVSARMFRSYKGVSLTFVRKVVCSSDQITWQLLAPRCRRTLILDEALHVPYHVYYIGSEMSTLTKSMNVLPAE